MYYLCSNNMTHNQERYTTFYYSLLGYKKLADHLGKEETLVFFKEKIEHVRK